jgi:hypothetical protein
VEEAKQNRWMRLREVGESLVLPGEGRDKGPRSFGGSFYATLNLEVGSHYMAPLTCGVGEGALES